jgi:dTDP-4-amino-4,6-dideoxygalactose transaminase
LSYFFPSLLTSPAIPKGISSSLPFTTNSGENALRLLLRSFKLPEKSAIAVPAFVCDSVVRAVLSEGLTPVFFDLKKNCGFWTDYDIEKITEQRIAAIILVHLYGFIHPDTDALVRFCKEKNIKLINDAAQCYGAPISGILGGNGIVYSFGPGKSTTAAGGGMIDRMDKTFHGRNASPGSWFRNFFANQKAIFFLKSRIYGYKMSQLGKIVYRILITTDNLLFDKSIIYQMTKFQRKAANYTMLQLEKANNERKLRHEVIAEALKNHSLLSLAYDDGKGMYFKIVLHTKGNSGHLSQYFKNNSLPYFNLFEVPNTNSFQFPLPVFSQNENRFFEISTEASIPLDEIKRVAGLLRAYH